MNVYRIYILLVWFDKKGRIFFEFICAPLLMIWQKGRKKFRVLYMHVYAWFPCFIQKGRNFLRVLYMHVYVIYMHVYFFQLVSEHICFSFQLVSEHICFVYVKSILHLCIYVLCVLCIHWISLLFIAMHELRGSFYEA